MKFSLFYLIFRGIGAGQHYFVAFLSQLSLQARGASVMSLLFQSVHKGIRDEYIAIRELKLRSYPAIFTGQRHINKIIPVSHFLIFSMEEGTTGLTPKKSPFSQEPKKLVQFA